MVALTGASGAGKTTLLQVLGTLDVPDTGKVLFRDTNLADLSRKAAGDFRLRNMGFVFQFHHLVAELSAAENVALPARAAGTPKKAALAKATGILAQLGLGHRLQHKPEALSGGERQRVAVARALVNDPDILLADEPTGNLDSANAAALFELLKAQTRTRGLACLVATHDLPFAQAADRVVQLQDGKRIEAEQSVRPLPSTGEPE